MKTHVRARPETVFRLAAQVEEWPRLLPHYDRVRVLREDGPRRIVEMAAHRDFLQSPPRWTRPLTSPRVRWTAIQTLSPDEGRITFRHIGGISRGMLAVWTIQPGEHGLTRVQLWHELPHWPLPLFWWLAGRLVVDAIAGRTLRRIKELAEASG